MSWCISSCCLFVSREQDVGKSARLRNRKRRSRLALESSSGVPFLPFRITEPVSSLKEAHTRSGAESGGSEGTAQGQGRSRTRWVRLEPRLLLEAFREIASAKDLPAQSFLELLQALPGLSEDFRQHTQARLVHSDRWRALTHRCFAGSEAVQRMQPMFVGQSFNRTMVLNSIG